MIIINDMSRKPNNHGSCVSCFIELFLHLLHEHLSGLEGGNLVLGNDDSLVLRDVASGLLRTSLHDEATKATKIHVFTIGERILHDVHEFLNC